MVRPLAVALVFSLILVSCGSEGGSEIPPEAFEDLMDMDLDFDGDIGGVPVVPDYPAFESGDQFLTEMAVYCVWQTENRGMDVNECSAEVLCLEPMYLRSEGLEDRFTSNAACIDALSASIAEAKRDPSQPSTVAPGWEGSLTRFTEEVGEYCLKFADAGAVRMLNCIADEMCSDSGYMAAMGFDRLGMTYRECYEAAGGT